MLRGLVSEVLPVPTRPQRITAALRRPGGDRTTTQGIQEFNGQKNLLGAFEDGATTGHIESGSAIHEGEVKGSDGCGDLIRIPIKERGWINIDS
jgi:hypothetical protein